MKYIINKCDDQGNHITGYEEILEGTKEECERDYRNYHAYEGPIDIEIVEEENKIEKAIEEFKALQSREINPTGTFDNAGRWYPADSEKAECCEGLRSPSRAYPYSLMVHCRTLKHVCEKYGLDYRTVKKIMNAEKPKRKVEKKKMWKKVALIDGAMQSVYSGEKYELGRTYVEKVEHNHQGGYFCYSTKKEAEMAVFPDSSVNVDAQKIVVQVEVWGRSIEYENGKHAFTYMKFVQ